MTATPFNRAVQAIVAGDEAQIRALLTAYPDLVNQRAPVEHQATLLHYVAANGVELQVSPPNAPEVARILLEAGSEVDATAPLGGDQRFTTPLCMTVTSIHPHLSGVQANLVDVFIDYEAKVNGIEDEDGPLGCALLFGYTQAAERLVLRGARVENIIYAAGLGRTDVVRRMMKSDTGVQNITRRTDDRAGRFSFPVPRDADAVEVAMIVAAMHNRLATLRVLLDSGIDVNAAPFCGQTALHFAAHLGNERVLEELLARGADASRVETQFGKTPAEWARETKALKIAERLEQVQ